MGACYSDTVFATVFATHGVRTVFVRCSHGVRTVFAHGVRTVDSVVCG